MLYLREVLGFSYKEIGAVMGLSMAATETLVFRARAALRREYERSGGTSFGSALLGFHLVRLGLDGRLESIYARTCIVSGFLRGWYRCCHAWIFTVILKHSSIDIKFWIGFFGNEIRSCVIENIMAAKVNFCAWNCSHCDWTLENLVVVRKEYIMALIVGLTGGIASGKSTVSNLIKDLGITVIDADIEARLAVEPGEKAYQQIVEHFGVEILLEDGSINRPKLGDIIFNQQEERMVLNGIVHPAVRERMNEKKLAAIQRGEYLIVMDIPLLFESKLTDLVEKIILVYVDEKIQLERLMMRNHYSETEAHVRIKSQMPLIDKKKHSDFIIDNNGSVEQTQKQLNAVLNKLGFVKEV